MLNKKLSFTKKITIFFLSVFVLTGIGIFLLSSEAEAASAGDVVINEIMWMGSSASTTDEWIELKNTTASPVDVDNWMIENGTYGATTTLTILAADCSTTTIAANGYFLISKYASTSASSKLDASPECVTTTIILIDDYAVNGALVLKDDTGTTIDQTPASTTQAWPAGITGTASSSMARDYTPGAGTSTANWHTAIIFSGWDEDGNMEKGTPGTYNGYSVSGTISQLNGTASGTFYINVQENASTTSNLATYSQNATGTYQMHLFASSVGSSNGKYDFFAFRDVDSNVSYSGGDPRRSLNNSVVGYTVTSTGLSSIDFKIALDPVISTATSPTHIGDTITITGSNFGGSTTTAEGRVYFSGQGSPEAQVSSWSTTTIQVVVPANAQTGSISVELGGWATGEKSITVKPKISSAVATNKSIVVNFDSYMDGSLATDLTNYTLYSPIGTAISLTDAWSEFRGNKIYIKGVSLTVGNTFNIVPGSALNGNSGTAIDVSYNATGTVATGPTVNYVYKQGQSTTTNYGSVGDTIIISGSNLGSTEGTLYFSPGPPSSGAPQSPIQATSISSWSATSITGVVPSGARTGPVMIITLNGLENEFSQNAFFDILTNVNYKILEQGTETTIPTSTARIVIGSMAGPKLYYVGDGNSSSPTTYNASSEVYTVSNVSSEGFNWVFDSSGDHIVGSGQELDSSATTTFHLATSATKISGTITNGGDTRTIVVWADPLKGTGEDMEWGEPVFVKTNSAGTVDYSVGLSATGTYMVGIEDPGFGGGSASNPKISPSIQEVNASTTSVTGIDFVFINATRRIRGKIEKAESKSFDIGPGMEAFHVWGYQPKENGLNASAMPDSEGYFDLYVNPGVYIVGVGGPNVPSPVEKQIEVLASDTNYATTNSAVDITLIIKAPTEYITGQVTDSSGNGISGASIFSWSSSGPGGGQAFTNSSGAFTLYVNPGTYTVEGFAPNFGKLTSRSGVTVSSGCADTSTCPTVDFSVSSEVATISGTVVQNSASSSDIEVWITNGETGYGLNGTRTGSDGTFSLRVPYGSGYYLHAAKPGSGEFYKLALSTFNSSNTSQSVPISVNICTISVQISLKSSFSSAFIEIYGSTGKGFSDNDVSASSDTFRKYSIEVPRPTSGTYTYTIQGGIPGYGPITATTTSIGSGDTTKTVSLTLDSNFYTISGSIADPDTVSSGNQAEGAFVWAASESGHSGGTVDSSGNFSFNLKSGTYDFGIDKKRYVGNMFSGVVISANTVLTDTYTLALTSASLTISGNVYIGSTAESGAWIWATNGSGGWSGDESDGNGAFSLQVGSGDWTIQAASEGYETASPSTVPAGTSGLSVTLTSISGYTSVAPTVESFVPKTGGVIQGENVKFEAPQGALDSQDTNTGRVTIGKSTSIPKTNDVKALGNFAYDITACNASGTPITVMNSAVTISLTYSASDLTSAGISTTTALGLSLGYFDSTLNKWVAISTNAATTSEGKVLYTGTTKHLSPYAPLIPSGANPPSAPTGLTATAGDAQVALTWTASANATKYNVYKKSGDTYPYLTQVTDVNYTDTSLTNGTTYYYKVSALNAGDDESVVTDVVSATPVSAGGGAVISGGGVASDTTAPSISNIETIVGDTTATITWQTSESSLSWIVYGTSTGYGLEKKETNYLTSHSLILSGLDSETIYHYQVKSKDSSGNIGSYTDKTFTTLALGEEPEEIVGEDITVPEITFEKPISEMTIPELEDKIKEILDAINVLQTLLAQMTGEVAIEGIPAGFSFENNLKLSDVSIDVKYLQIVLNSNSVTRLAESGVGSPGNETNYFGSLTKSGVIKFQEKYTNTCLSPWGLTSGTGFVGSTTRDKLNGLLK